MAQRDFTDEPLADLLSLEGRGAVVTGGGRGIGFATVRRLHEAGAAVTVVDKDADLCARVEQTYEGVSAINADVTEAGILADVADRVAADGGRVDIWVNNAGIYPSTPLAEMNEGEWDAVINLNLRAVFVGSREASKKMVAAGNGGVIINIGSLNAHFALGPGFVHYTTTKHGILGMTKALAAEVGPNGIRVLAISPQLTETEGAMGMSGAFVSDEGVREMMDQYASRTPLGRIGKPDDVARTILFAVTDLAGYMTGSELMADGGALAFG